MQSKTMKYTLSCFLVLLWMALIFHLSSHVAQESNALSMGITDYIVIMLEKFFPGINFDLRDLHHFIRKIAHFIAYLVLGFLSINALRKIKVCGYRSIVLSIVICTLYAIFDEIHQLFIPGRSGQVSDVFIDCLGAGIGILLYLLIENIKRKKGPSVK